MSDDTRYASPLLSQVSLSTTTTTTTTAPESTTFSINRKLTSLTGLGATAGTTATTTTTTWTSESSEAQNLPKLLVGDVVIGTSVTFCIAPFVAMVDQAIVQRSAGTHTILASVQSTMGHMVRQPALYVRSTPFLWMWALYAATYSTANTLKTLQEYVHDMEVHHHGTNKPIIMCTSPRLMMAAVVSTSCDHQKEVNVASISINNNNYNSESVQDTSWTAKTSHALLGTSLGLLVGTSSVNMTMSLLKDRAYARMFGSQQPTAATISTFKPPAVPKLSYALWMTRDFLVVGSSFLMPDLVVQTLLNKGYIDHTQTGVTLRSAQFMIPVASQLVAGPIHLLGLHVYQQPNLAPFERLRSLQQHGAVLSVIGARMARILPGYSIGGVGNSYLRDKWRNWIRTTA